MAEFSDALKKEKMKIELIENAFLRNLGKNKIDINKEIKLKELKLIGSFLLTQCLASRYFGPADYGKCNTYGNLSFKLHSLNWE